MCSTTGDIDPVCCTVWDKEKQSNRKEEKEIHNRTNCFCICRNRFFVFKQLFCYALMMAIVYSSRNVSIILIFFF